MRDEYYCGRRFHSHSHHAVWFIEEDELKIYQTGGELACVMSSAQIDGVEDRGGKGSERSKTVLQLPAPLAAPSQAPIRRAA